jgi:hypothetical protein
MIIANRIHQYHISKYQKGKDSLELILKKDGRFQGVHVFFYSTRPSTWILAPEDLSLDAKHDLSNLVSNAFGPLPVPIRYASSQFLVNTNGAN